MLTELLHDLGRTNGPIGRRESLGSPSAVNGSQGGCPRPDGMSVELLCNKGDRLLAPATSGQTDGSALLTRIATLTDLTTETALLPSELVRDPPRSYQVECFVAAALASTIVYLPTGAGKTLIAAMLISLMHQLNPTKTCLFLVNRVPLAFQQAEYLLAQTRLETLVSCGMRRVKR